MFRGSFLCKSVFALALILSLFSISVTGNDISEELQSLENNEISQSEENNDTEKLHDCAIIYGENGTQSVVSHNTSYTNTSTVIYSLTVLSGCRFFSCNETDFSGECDEFQENAELLSKSDSGSVLVRSYNCSCIQYMTVAPEEDHDYFEGDIIFPPRIEKDGTAASGILTDKLGIENRWKDRTIPYAFHGSIPLSFRKTFEKATAHIMERTCMKFKSWENEKDYVEVTSDNNGCRSYIGRIGGMQQLWLGPGCWNIGTHIHELIHAIGFFHEQSRTDRDSYVTIHWKNIVGGRKNGNFQKYGTDTITSFNISYDYASIMHYGTHYFSKNWRPTITSRTGVKIGQREGMSEKDVEKITKMYCPEWTNEKDESEESGNSGEDSFPIYSRVHCRSGPHSRRKSRRWCNRYSRKWPGIKM